jgi:hypothetical protein
VTVTATAQGLRPRTGPEIIDAAVQLLRRSYAASYAVWFAYCVVYAVAWRPYSAKWPTWVSYVVVFGTPALPYAVMLALSADAYLGRPVRIDRALARVARRWVAVYVAYLLRLAVISLGIVCLVVPGVVFWARSFATLSAVVLEDCPALGAVDRSLELTRGDLSRIVGVLGLAVLLVWVTTWGEIKLHHMAIAHHLLNRPLREALYTVLSSLFEPFVSAVVVVLYYDLRIRKEGFDLELMARSVM